MSDKGYEKHDLEAVHDDKSSILHDIEDQVKNMEDITIVQASSSNNFHFENERDKVDSTIDSSLSHNDTSSASIPLHHASRLGSLVNAMNGTTSATKNTDESDGVTFPITDRSFVNHAPNDGKSETGTKGVTHAQSSLSTDIKKYDPGTSAGQNCIHNTLDRLEYDMLEKLASSRDASRRDELGLTTRSAPGAVYVPGKSSLDWLENEIVSKSERTMMSSSGDYEAVYEDIGRSHARTGSHLTGDWNEVALNVLDEKGFLKLEMAQMGSMHSRDSSVAKSTGGLNNIIGQCGEHVPGYSSPPEQCPTTYIDMPDLVHMEGELGTSPVLSSTGLSIEDALSTDDDATRIHRNPMSVATTSWVEGDLVVSNHLGQGITERDDQDTMNHQDNIEITNDSGNQNTMRHRVSERLRSAMRPSSPHEDDDSRSGSSIEGDRSWLDPEQGTTLPHVDSMVLQAEPVTTATSAFVVNETYERKRIYWCIGVGSIVFAIFIAIAVIVAVTASGGDNSPNGNGIINEQNITRTYPPSLSPSQSPTVSPASESLDRFLTFLQTIYSKNDDYFEATFSNTTSAQYRAAEWIADEDKFPRVSLTDAKVLQRFVLASFYFSTEGDGWKQCFRTDPICTGNFDQTSWLSNFDECIWDSIDCGDGVRVSRIFFRSKEDYGLQGTLPPELAFLSVVETLIVNLNQIGGTIPEVSILLGYQEVENIFFWHLHPTSLILCDMCLKSLSTWSNLKTFRVDGNRISGIVSASMIQSNQLLETIHVQNNALTGMIPDTLTHVSLRNIQMQGNKFVGPIPGTISQATNLSKLSYVGGGGLSDFHRCTCMLANSYRPFPLLP
jgi:hypothetical protein